MGALGKMADEIDVEEHESSSYKGPSAVVDIIPDNDSFLPRYLTVQLLEILAKLFGKPKPMPENIKALANKHAKFIESFQVKELFNPLTYSIFWRDNIEKALVEYKGPLDVADKYNRAPLTLAIANEDFDLAVQILSRGATLLLEDKLVLEIALISMIQREPKIINQIIESCGTNDKEWVSEYLEYLNGYIIGEPTEGALRYHDVLNPPLRHFGQVLDTLAYFNGLPSHYGFLSPSVEILTTHLQLFTEDQLNEENKTLFGTISAAYTNTNETCKFYGNLPTDDNASKILSEQIVNNINKKNNMVSVLFGGWAGNSIALGFINDALIFSNLGIGGSPQAGTKIFMINNPAGITSKTIQTIMSGLGSSTAPIEILALLGEIVDPKPIFTLNQVLNPIDNCIFVNPRAVMQGILLVLSAYNKDGKITAQNLSSLSASVDKLYASYVDSLYKYSAADLAKFMRNNELLQNKRIECCALAIDYINQHYNEATALPRCIELKNALEFVGLGEYYMTSIDPKAQAAIQQMVIHEQETTAIQVIEQENLSARQG